MKQASFFRIFMFTVCITLFAQPVQAQWLERFFQRPNFQKPSVQRQSDASFDYYILALSWSPGFCALNTHKRDTEQCQTTGIQQGDKGFTVHGLWPQRHNGRLNNCDTSRPVSRQALQDAKGLFPDEGLARHEWKKHGTCSGLDPSSYFKATRSAREIIQIPDLWASLVQKTQVSAQDITRAFVQSNRGLRPDMISISCRNNVFQEIRVCLTKDLRGFQSCEEISRRTCRSQGLKFD